jgi:hypothetical protein
VNVAPLEKLAARIIAAPIGIHDGGTYNRRSLSESSERPNQCRSERDIDEWERIRVVKTSPDYNILMTRGYGADGTPVKEVVVSKMWNGGTQFVSIDVLTTLRFWTALANNAKVPTGMLRRGGGPQSSFSA